MTITNVAFQFDTEGCTHTKIIIHHTELNPLQEHSPCAKHDTRIKKKKERKEKSEATGGCNFGIFASTASENKDEEIKYK